MFNIERVSFTKKDQFDSYCRTQGEEIRQDLHDLLPKSM